MLLILLCQLMKKTLGRFEDVAGWMAVQGKQRTDCDSHSTHPAKTAVMIAGSVSLCVSRASQARIICDRRRFG